MIINIVIATIVYFMLGFLLFVFIEPENHKANIQMFIRSFIVSLIFLFIFYNSWILLGLEAHKGVEGLFSRDGSTYYLDAVQIVNSGFSGEVLDRVITDHYHELFVAIQLYVFGVHLLIPKIYQILLFSVAVVLWVSIARDILKDPKLVRYFFYMLLFCLPLLSYSTEITKEISTFFTTTVTVYGFTKYYYTLGARNKYLLVTLLGLILMFMIRREFALVMFFSIIIAAFLGSGLPLQKKILWGSASMLLFFIVSSLPFFQEIEAAAPLTEGGTIRAGRESSAVLQGGGQGMIGNMLLILQNPLTVGPYFIYGIFQLFFHPPFLYTPSEMLSRGTLFYFVAGYYNLFFAVMLPAFYFGAKHLYKNNKRNPVLIALLIYFIFASLGAIFMSDSYRRFKISYFWPIAYLYISYGIATFPLWRKRLPIVALVFIALFIAYFTFDLIGFASS